MEWGWQSVLPPTQWELPASNRQDSQGPTFAHQRASPLQDTSPLIPPPAPNPFNA